MRILSRYVLREFLIPFSYCFFGLISIYLLFSSFDVISACFEQKPPISLVLAYFGGTVAQYLEWLLPAVFLLATLYTMWQFCRSSELTAMRANGISFVVIVLPILSVAIIAAALSYINSEYYAPVASRNAKLIKDTNFATKEVLIHHNVGFSMPTLNHTWLIGEMDINHPDRLKNVTVTVFRPDGSRDFALIAGVVEHLDGMWWAHSPVSYTFYNELDTVIEPPTEDFALSTLVPLYDFPETPAQIVLQNKGDSDFDSIEDRKTYLEMLDSPTRDEKRRIKYNIYRRFAAPFSIIVITLFAIPVGIASGRQSVFKGIILALTLFLGYYVLNILGMLLANRGLFTPAFCAFLPSLIFFIGGCYFFYKQR